MSETMVDVDIAIVGGGMVGGLLAAAVAQPNLFETSSQKAPPSIAVIDSAEPSDFPLGSNPAYDLRVSALSVASRRMLEAVGAWDGIEKRRICPYRNLSVWDGESDGRTDFHARDAGVAALGYIVENRIIQLSLWERLRELPNVTFLCPAKLESLKIDDTAVQLNLSGTSVRSLSARVVIGADGAGSVVRKHAGISVSSQRYDQQALVANVTTELPQQDITWQRFVPTGPQAMLPLCGDRASLVWYHHAEEIARLKELDDGAFIQALCAAFPPELGGIESVQARASFPISKAHVNSYTAHRIALAGDAAHTVHPLAGQGVNLGLLDAACLAETLMNAQACDRDLGAAQVLARYERWRGANNALMIESLDAIHKAFLPQPAWFRQLRSFGLNSVNKISPLRNILMDHAMGTAGDLPRLARP